MGPSESSTLVPRGVTGTRFGESRQDGFNMVALLLPGVAVTYYGEEIGMVNTDIPFNETVGERAYYVRGLQRDVVYSWLTNRALVYEPTQMRGEGGSCGVSAKMSTDVHIFVRHPPEHKTKAKRVRLL